MCKVPKSKAALIIVAVKRENIPTRAVAIDWREIWKNYDKWSKVNAISYDHEKRRIRDLVNAQLKEQNEANNWEI